MSFAQRHLMISLKTLTTCLVLLLSFSASTVAQEENAYAFEIQRRLNAHGDEYMALALTSDERHLIIGTESGKLLVWGIAERRILKQLDQGEPVHCVVALNDADTFVAAGGPHTGATQRATVRKWRLSTGVSEEWQGLTEGTILALAFDPKTELVTAGSTKGQLAVWHSTNGQIITKRTVNGGVSGLAINGQEVYVTTFQPSEEESQNSILRLRVDEPSLPETDLTKDKDGSWGDLKTSPDGRFLAAQSEGDNERGVALFELSTGNKISTLEGEKFAWSTNGQLVLFDHEVAIGRVSIDAHGQISHSKLSEGAQWHGLGDPSNMTGRVISKDGSRAWEVFQIGATLVELDLDNKGFKELHRVNGHLYALHVNEKLGLIATGGDDKLVRVRKLSDLSLVKEFNVELGVPQGVAMMDDGRHVVFSSGLKNTPTRVVIGDIVTGQSRTLYELQEPFVQVEAAAGGFIYRNGKRLVLAEGFNGTTVREYAVVGAAGDYAISANGQWLVAENRSGKLFRFDIKTGRRTNVGRQKVESLTRLTITNDGRYVYTIDFQGTLKRWETRSGVMKEVATIRGQARTLKLSREEREILFGGNHRDVVIVDIASGKEKFNIQMAAADFYVTNVWLGGDRLLFSTDAGVLFDGLVTTKN